MAERRRGRESRNVTPRVYSGTADENGTGEGVETVDDTRRCSIEFYFNAELDPPILIALRMTYTREDALWVGVCEELGTSTYGNDLDQVSRELKELVLFELNAVEADGERANVFSTCGVEILPLPETLLDCLRDVRQSRLPALAPVPEASLPPWLPQDQPSLTPAVA